MCVCGGGGVRPPVSPMLGLSIYEIRSVCDYVLFFIISYEMFQYWTNKRITLVLYIKLKYL